MPLSQSAAPAPSTRDARPHGGRLRRTLSTVEYFTFGFGTMVGVGWLVLIDDWLGRGGPGGAMLAYLLGGVLLLPIAFTYARLVRAVPDAGAEIAYTEMVFPRFWSFAAGWMMVLAYAIVCPWEAVAIGNLLARQFPAMNTWPLYQVGETTIYAPRLVCGLVLTALITLVNYRGMRRSGTFQNVMTFGLLAVFAIFAVLGFARGDASNLEPLFAQPGGTGLLVSTLLVLQIVPYYMTGFESIVKGSEESRPGYDSAGFSRAIFLALFSGAFFYVTVVAAVAFVLPWREIVEGSLGTEAAFERAFGSRAIAQLILFGAFLSLLKVFNGNFVAATRLVLAVGRRGWVHPSLADVHPRFGTPSVAVVAMGALTAAASFLGDSLLVPISEVGSLAVGIGWLSACLAYLGWSRRYEAAVAARPLDRAFAVIGAVVGVGIVLMKAVPLVPGSFGPAEWIAFGSWAGLGLAFWVARPRGAPSGVE
jgi:amino acid transporter